jgi:hypothetical protein
MRFSDMLVCVFRHVFDVLADITELVVQILSARLNLVFDFGATGIDARFSGVNPFLKPLKRAPDGYGNVVAILVDDTLNQFEVFSLQWHSIALVG